MKVAYAVFTIVMSALAITSPICNFVFCAAAEGETPRPPEARLFDHLTSWDYRSDLDHLSCVCQKQPKLLEVLQMSSPISPPNGDIESLSGVVKKTLRANGWRKCKSIYTEFGILSDTYWKDGKLLKVFERYSQGVGDSLAITIATEKMKPAILPPSKITVSKEMDCI
jgi:hypothetical protein